MSSGDTTVDHEFIRKWTEQRGGRPTRVKGTEGRDGAGILRIDFNEPEDSLEEISWDEFFETFDDRELAFLYQDKTADGHTSRFFKFVHRTEREQGGGLEHDRLGTKSEPRSRPSEEESRSGSARRGKDMAKEARHQGTVKDPEHDGRLKENREAGRTKSTTPASAARAQGKNEEGGGAHERGRGQGGGRGDASQGGEKSGSGARAEAGRESGGRDQSSGGGADDLKSREYTDEKGEVHHHTRAYMEQHKK